MFRLSLEEAERRNRAGLLSDRDWNRYYRAWLWSAGRMGGTAGLIHDAFWLARGEAAYVHRINRVRRVLGLALYRDMPALESCPLEASQ